MARQSDEPGSSALMAKIDFRGTATERFWAKVLQGAPNECWPWMASTTGSGYGAFSRPGGQRVPAHRFAWEMANGTIPPGLFVCHTCDNKKCVNLAHLWLGTQSENMRDASMKGLLTGGGPPGERNGGAKLTPAQVTAIRSAYKEGEPIRAIARRFPISRSAVQFICQGKTWKGLWPMDQVH
jgi:hypothetical protein